MTVLEVQPRVAPPDRRRYWRVTLGLLAAVPFAVKGIEYAIIPTGDNDTLAQAAAKFAAHPGLAWATEWLDAVFALTLLPAIFTIALVARRRAPRLTAVGASMALLGWMAPFAIDPNGDQLGRLLARNSEIPTVGVQKLSDAWGADPVASLASLLFILGLIIGLPLLGIALWRGGGSPSWAGIALAVGTVTHPFLSAAGGVVVCLGLFVAAAGCAGAGWTLLRGEDDDFDLPPLPAR